MCCMHEKKGNVTARLDAHCHMLSYTYWCIANRHTQRLEPHTHTDAWCFPGGHGASGTELESLVRLFRSNYRNRTISATTAPFFIFLHERGRGRESAREREGEKTKL